MESEWKITSNYIDGKKYYGVYRLKDTSEIDHSGNREQYGDYVENRNEAVEIADKLNKGALKCK